MILIFAGSGDSKSGNRSSRLIGPLVRFFAPNIAPETLDVIILSVRKTAHLTEYAVLALLVWRARRQPQPGDFPVWRGRDGRWTLLICLLYAATDEWHQSFVPNREAALHDVFI
ncbi:MAG: VanZ family protein, partial [Opitutaceae bacterium]|nr:VanZ family protein [Verrucomicrobiales bacterium]